MSEASVSRVALLERHQVLLTRDCECWGLESPGPMRACVACRGVGFRPKTLEELLEELDSWVLVQTPADYPDVVIVIDMAPPIYAETPWMAAALAVVKSKSHGGETMTTDDDRRAADELERAGGAGAQEVARDVREDAAERDKRDRELGREGRDGEGH